MWFGGWETPNSAAPSQTVPACVSNIESLPVPEPNPQMEEESSTVNMFPFPQWVVMVIVIALRKTFSVRSENVWTGGHPDRHLMDI